MFDPQKILETLNRYRVEYVVIGGFAATLYSCPEQTFDLDILFADHPKNRQKLLSALHEIEARWDKPLTDTVLQRQPVFALNTKFGDLDILTEIPGLGKYEDASAHQKAVRFGDQAVSILDLEMLIKTKEAAADPNPRKQAALQYLKATKVTRSET